MPEFDINGAVSGSPVVVFSKTYCPYCVEAKRLLKLATSSLTPPIEPVTFELDYMSDGSSIQRKLKPITHCSTVPQIFIGGRFIGGCSDLQTMIRENKLNALLEQVSKSVQREEEEAKNLH